MIDTLFSVDLTEKDLYYFTNNKSIFIAYMSKKNSKAELTALLDWHLHNGIDVILEGETTNKLNIANQSIKPGRNTIAANVDEKSRALSDKAATLTELRAAVESFDGCPIKLTALNTVFGDGSENADIMLIGEAPGAAEDKEGVPFCGQSGKLLTNILKSIGLERSKVYITNTLYWRPPANRRPTRLELEACRPFVEKQIALVKPKIILLIGSTAVESLLGAKVAMHDVRDGSYAYNNKYLEKPIRTIVIFHPSYLLRQPTKKKLMWFDMLRVKKIISEE